MSRWLLNVRPWSRVILLNQMIMSVYLWHITAMIAVVSIAVLLGGLGLEMQPGIATWWWLRPIWIACFVAALIIFVLTFLRFEAAPRAADAETPGPVRAIVGALLTCSGLVMMALSGIGSEGPLGVNWVALVLVAVGVALATLRAGPGRAG